MQGGQQIVAPIAGNKFKYNSSMKVPVIPARLVSMNPSLAPSVSSLEDNQSFMNMTEDSRDKFGHEERNKKLTMNSIDNTIMGYSHY